MNMILLIGGGAGLASMALFASAATGTPAAIVLFYLSPLPLFISGFGWGWLAAGLGAVFGALAIAIMFGALAGAGYFATIALPAAILCYLALLARPAAEADDGGEGKGAVEWYPPGRLIMWSCVMAGILFAASLPMLGTDLESVLAAIRDAVQEGAVKSLVIRDNLDATGKEELAKLAAFFARVLPQAFVSVWILTTLGNLWAAAKIIDFSGAPLRSWSPLPLIDYPGAFGYAFAAALLASFAPGLTGYGAGAFATAFAFAYLILGMAIIHVITQGFVSRTFLLAAIYMSLFAMPLAALLPIILGIGEPIFKLRQRALAAQGHPPRRDGQ